MQTSLRQIRVFRGLNIQDVAKAVDCDPGNLSRIERGQQQPNLDLAERLSKFYNGEIGTLEILSLKRNQAA